MEPSKIRWSRVNSDPFEYAIQQGPHGDEFVKLLDGTCLRRRAQLHDALADKLAGVKEYTNEFLTEAAILGKLVLGAKSPFILVSVETRDAAIAALRDANS